ncbi:MAG: sodium-translocating pyrophosphatase [Promethearchaeota archaeon]
MLFLSKDISKLREILDGGWANNPVFFVSLYVIIPVSLVVAFTTVVLVFRYINKETMGHPKMVEIHKAIKDGAKTYLFHQARYLLYGLAILFVPVGLTGWQIFPEAHFAGFFLTGGIFLIGSLSSYLAGYIGMDAATRANIRVVTAVEKDHSEGFALGYYAGMITGLLNISIFILGIWLIFNLSGFNLYILVGYGFGASVSSLFAQVGGGIFTKSADVGADLVGKIEVGIPEDDPRNPAVIADNVGDNVGDCAGRGADLFESASSDAVGGLILGTTIFILTGDPIFIIRDMLFLILGVYSTIICTRFLHISIKDNPARVVWIVFVIAMAINMGITLTFTLVAHGRAGIYIFFASVFGLLSAILSVFLALYYTDIKYKPTLRIAESSTTGPATNVLSGLATGFESTFFPVLVFGISVVLSSMCGYLYAVATYPDLVASTGGVDMLGNPLDRQHYYFIMAVWGLNTASVSGDTMISVILSFDTFGPIMDNAAGITEMAGDEASEDLRAKLDKLDSTGNTTKAVAKGFALICGGFSSIVLFQNFLLNTRNLSQTISGPIPAAQLADISNFLDISNPAIVFGILLGVGLPFLFSALTIRAVSDGANIMVKEVRRQFKEIPGLMEGTGKPDYNRGIEICTSQAIKRMGKPVLLVIAIPLTMGILFGPFFVAAILIGNLIGCLLLGITMTLGGAAFDNAKKGIESGLFGGKGTQTHFAGIVGDTVGDPLKDTAGPSMNIIITTLNTMALTFVPVFIATGFFWTAIQGFALF